VYRYRFTGGSWVGSATHPPPSNGPSACYPPAMPLSTVYRLCEERGLQAGNVFHAGDGNLHPHVLLDARDPVSRRNALDTSHEILRMCIAMGGMRVGTGAVEGPWI